LKTIEGQTLNDMHRQSPSDTARINNPLNITLSENFGFGIRARSLAPSRVEFETMSDIKNP